MKKSIKITLFTTGISAVLILAAALLVSPVAKRYLVAHGKELTGRTLAIERLRFNVFTGTLRVGGLRMLEADDSTTFASVGEYYMRMRLWPLLRHRVAIRQIAITEPGLNIYQKGPRFNFDDLLLRFAPDSTDTTADSPETSPSWEVGIDDIRITGGHIFYQDMQIGATWGFNDLDVTVPGIYFKDKTDVGILFNFAQGGSLGLQLNYDMDNADYDLRIDLRELALNGRLPYVRQTLDAGSLNGLFSADLHVNGNLQSPLDLYLDGAIDLADFSLCDAHEQEVVRVDSLHVGLTRGSLRHNQFHFDRLYLLGMAGRFEIYENGSNNIAALIRQQPDASVSAAPTPEAAGAGSNPPADSLASASPTAPLDLRIEDIEIARGAVHITDRSHVRTFDYRLSNIRMKSGFDMNKPNRIVVEAQVQKTGKARIRWEGSLSDLDNQNILVNLTNIDLRDFSPYSEHYTAYPLTQGNLSFRSQNIIRNRRITGTNHLDMFDPAVDKKRKDLQPEFKIPLKLGLYVLKDKKGHVKIDLPVEGSIDNPDFSYRRIVMKALGNVLLKVVTAPFSFLAGGNNLEYIAIEPLQWEFTSEQYAQLDKLADMLRDRPEMKVSLTQRIHYAEALGTQAVNNLKMSYYNHLRQADSTAAGMPLTMIEYEKIQHLDFRAEAVMQFADSLLRQAGTDPAKWNAREKALQLYGDRAAEQLMTLLERRNTAIANYMTGMQGLPAGAVRVATLETEALHAYTGRNRYSIAVEIEGETAAVAEAPEDVTAAREAMGFSDASSETETISRQVRGNGTATSTRQEI